MRDMLAECFSGSVKRTWQDVDDVLGYFGKRISDARAAYLSYVEEGVDQGRRKELVRGGLIRSLGGWSEAKKLRPEGQPQMMSDERILGESDFVDSMTDLAREFEMSVAGVGYAVERGERIARDNQ